MFEFKLESYLVYAVDTVSSTVLSHSHILEFERKNSDNFVFVFHLPIDRSIQYSIDTVSSSTVPLHIHTLQLERKHFELPLLHV